MAIRECVGAVALCLKGMFCITLFGPVLADSVTLSWNPNPESDISGYRIYYGPIDQGATTLDVGVRTSQLITNLNESATYFFFVTAYNTAGLESEPSQRVYYAKPSPPPPPQSGATYIASDRRTSGLWRGNYGAEGGISPWGYLSVPEFVSVGGKNNYVWGWDPSYHIEESLERPSGGGRIPLLWYNTNFFEISLRFRDGLTHQTAFYFFDLGNVGRIQELEFFDENSGSLLARSTITNFNTGIYSVWELSGNIRVRVTRMAGDLCLMSGILFGSGSSAEPAASVSFLGEDVSTGGSWIGNYGRDGCSIATEPSIVGTNYSIDVKGANSWIWESTTSNPTALQKVGASGRKASTWYDSEQFSVLLNADGKVSQKISLYCVDYASSTREQTIQFFDAMTGVLLDETTLTEFTTGVWLSYEVTAPVIVRLIAERGPNAVLSGIFLD